MGAHDQTTRDLHGLAGSAVKTEPAPVTTPPAMAASAASDGAPAATAGTGPADTAMIAAAQAAVGTRYRIASLAGAGGMGRVFGATDEVLGRRVAIKFLRPGGKQEDAGGAGAFTTQVRARLVTEARAMAGLKHPNACPILDVSVPDAGEPFIVMEWVDGIDLRTAWRGLSLDARIAQFAKIVDGVAALHAAGLVHLDLKPANILVDRRGEPVLVDFGLARGRADRDAAPGTGTPAGGTPGYAAPEQFDQEATVGPTADVYSLGVILFEALTDRLPFEGATVADVVQQARTLDPPLPETIAPGTPAALQRICLMAMERDPALRYRAAAAMSLDLGRYLRGETVAARPTVLTGRFTEQVEQQINRAEEWRRLGLVTPAESERLVQHLAVLQRPESPWIIDSRRLSLSQVSLYLGGWLVVLAITVGAWYTRDLLSPALRWLVPTVVAGLLIAAGLVLHATNQRRVALGYLVTASIAIPVCVWLMLRETHWLSAGGVGMGESELLAALRDDPMQGVYNRQILAIALSWLASCVVMRFLTGSGAFVLFGVLAGAASWGALWLNLGRLIRPDRITLAEFGAWMASAGIVLLPAGLLLNHREEGLARSLGRARLKRHDSPPILGVAVALVVGGLSTLARQAPELYIPGLVADRAAHPTTTLRALAFIINGFLLLGVAWMLSKERSITRQRLASLLRWLIPSHFLGSVLFLEIENASPGWRLWLALLPAASVVLCYVSVLKQWKPFLFTGLAYLAVGYVRAYMRLPGAVGSDSTVRVVLMAGLVVIGLAAMVLAWRAPRWPGEHRARPSPDPGRNRATGAGPVSRRR